MTEAEALKRAQELYGPRAYVTDKETDTAMTWPPDAPDLRQRFAVCRWFDTGGGFGRCGSSIGTGDTWEEAFQNADRFVNGTLVRLKREELEAMLRQAPGVSLEREIRSGLAALDRRRKEEPKS